MLPKAERSLARAVRRAFLKDFALALFLQLFAVAGLSLFTSAFILRRLLLLLASDDAALLTASAASIVGGALNATSTGSGSNAGSVFANGTAAGTTNATNAALFDASSGPSSVSAGWGPFSTNMGYVYASSFFVLELGRSITINQYWTQAYLGGLRLSNALRHLIFVKSAAIYEGQLATGDVVNMLASDSFRFMEAGTYGIFVISCPIIMLAVVVVMLFVIGPSVLAGFAVLFLMIPMQAKIGKRTGAIRRQCAKVRDAHG